jgi:hypothetical protein
MKSRENIIYNYIAGYNEFDINKMTSDLDEAIVFEHLSSGEVTMLLVGLEAFKKQAEQAKSYFSVRTQTIKSYKHQADETEIEIDYDAVLAMDFPNGLKKGNELKLQGRSIFKFSNDKIIKLTDIS